MSDTHRINTMAHGTNGMSAGKRNRNPNSRKVIEPKIPDVFQNLDCKEVHGEVAIWDLRNSDTVVISDLYINISEWV